LHLSRFCDVPRVIPAGPDGPFVNNYGVWVDEFKALGMADTIEREFNETLCYFQEKKEV
jgi:lycopene epsilon-cyclase